VCLCLFVLFFLCCFLATWKVSTYENEITTGIKKTVRAITVATLHVTWMGLVPYQYRVLHEREYVFTIRKVSVRLRKKQVFLIVISWTLKCGHTISCHFRYLTVYCRLLMSYSITPILNHIDLSYQASIRLVLTLFSGVWLGLTNGHL
jgi:hypothetical protein